MSRPSTRQVEPGSFAANLNSALRERDQTSESFAREIDVTLRTVQRWRSGDSQPSGHQAVLVARTLGLTVEQMYPVEEAA